VEDDSW
jgi:hypothetical protein